ncbi:MAG: cytochrome c, partial [Methyloceanibacter sp.]
MPSTIVARSWLGRLAAVLVGSTALLAAALPATAADKTLADRGEVLVRENCSRCHAVGKEGQSPHKDAP